MNRETRWDEQTSEPSGWGHVIAPSPMRKTVNYFYEKMQFFRAHRPTRNK